MEEKQLQQLEAFGFTTVESRDHYTVDYALQTMKEAYNRALSYYDAQFKTEDDLFKQGMVDASMKAFEDFTEAFRDIVMFFLVETGKNLPDTLLGVIKSFARIVDCDEHGTYMLDFLYARNKLVHEYYDREYNIEQFKIAMDNHSEGLINIYDRVYTLISDNKLLGLRIEK